MAVHVLAWSAAVAPLAGGFPGIDDLPRLVPGRTFADNALWIENPLEKRFNSSKQVVVAQIKGPAVITMIHFAMPQALTLNRMCSCTYWDGETSPASIVLSSISSVTRRIARSTAPAEQAERLQRLVPPPFTSARIGGL
jgi:hypothetical protein